METFKLTFCHPVKGIIKLICPNEKLCKVIPLDTKDSNILEVSLLGFPKGKWRAIFEWEFDGREFFREEEIEV